MTKYETAKAVAHEAIKALHTNPKKKGPSGAELLNWVKENRPQEYQKVKNSWGSFLTKATDDSESKIRREPGRYGYIIATDTSSTQTDALEPTLIEPKTQREAKLYNLLVDWLISKDYRSEDTSTKRKGGAWGNPDIVGIKEAEVVGGYSHLELVSIEAKVTEKDWRRVFFEAVSHKRFADRAYFAFSFPSEEAIVSTLPEYIELREYGEKYRVGILVVFIEPKKYKALSEDSNIENLSISLEDVRVEEVWPAMSDPVSPFTRDKFIREVLEIETMKELHKFGE
jgi:hypothetical protein